MLFHSPSECLNSVYAFLQPIPFCMARSRSGGSCKHRLCSGVAATRFGWCGAFKRLLTPVCTSLEAQQGLSLLFSSVPKGTSALVVMEMQPATVVSCYWQLAALSVWGKQVMKNWHVKKGGIDISPTHSTSTLHIRCQTKRGRADIEDNLGEDKAQGQGNLNHVFKSLKGRCRRQSQALSSGAQGQGKM